jgi:hypothetical protein
MPMPVGYRDIIEYAERNGLEGDDVNSFARVIASMDETFRAWFFDREKAKAKRGG